MNIMSANEQQRKTKRAIAMNVDNRTPEVDVETERIDDIPLLLQLLVDMGVPETIDHAHTPHGNWEGLSVGWVATVWLVYILTQADHRMSHVRRWVDARRNALSALIGQPIRETDFTDDRLAQVLRYLAQEEVWKQVEAALTQRCIRVYALQQGPIRLDATEGQVNHDPDEHTLFQIGRTKDNTFDVQFKLMLGSLDPLGFPVAVAIVPGNKVDDPLYVPVYRRIRETLDEAGFLYIGDCKMGAAETRATISAGGDYYLMPLAMVGETPELLDTMLAQWDAGEVTITDVFTPETPEEATEPDVIAKGFETTREQTAQIDGHPVTWTERILVVQSASHAKRQRKALAQRLERAEAALYELTPEPGRGKRQYREEAPLREAVAEVMSQHDVDGLLDVTLERQEEHRHIRAYGDRPARTETTVRYQVHVARRSEAIARAKRRLGWRVYATNAPVAQLSLQEAVWTYRDQYIVERDFSRLHGPLGITPMYVQRDDHACGLIRLLTIALRGMVLFEYVVRRQLAEEEAELSGVYAGNPTRSTARPSTELMLEVFDGITRTCIRFPDGRSMYHITPLTPVQNRILGLLGLSPTLYTNLATDHMDDESHTSVI